MKLIVNSSSLIPPLSGIGRYTQNLLQCLLDIKRQDKSRVEEVRAFNPLRFYQEHELCRLLESLNSGSGEFKGQRGLSLRKLTQIRKLFKSVPGASTVKQILQKRLLKSKMTMYRESIYWEPNYILQEFDGISIPTIYDLSHVRYPEFHPAQRRRWLDDNLMSSLERATAIITISEFSKKEIINHFSIKKEKISVISPAVADDFRYPYNTQEKAEMRQFYSLPSTFILSVGTLEPRKNIKGLLSAFKSLPEPLKNAFPLVVVGCAGWLSEDVEQIMQPMIKRGQVIRLGYVRQQHLPILFSAASLFVYVSHYEGYGMPIAEAMCSGVPVITSNISSMPEVAAGCAKLVNPNNTDEIASEIQELLENTQVRGQLVELAKQKSDSYLWGNSAKKLVDVLQKQRT